MSSSLPVGEMIARLETKIAFHREQEELHAKAEAAHAEQRSLHGAELRKASEQLEVLKTVSAAVSELIADVKPPSRLAGTVPLKSGQGHWVSVLLKRVIEEKEPGEVFGASSLIAEIEKLWGTRLIPKIDPRSATAALRRWGARGRLDVVRHGTSHRESLYTKTK
jgi:hypothetical protein